MTRWNIAATRENIERVFGREQCEVARACLQSAVERKYYAYYHYHEANDLFTQFAQEHFADSSLIEVAWSNDDDLRSEFQTMVAKVGANVVACIQSMHALADILAHAVYFSLAENLEAGPLSEAEISASTVVLRLSGRPELEKVHRLLSAVTSGGQFGHLVALANHSKHRSIIRTSVSEDMTGQAPTRHTLKLSSFQFKGKSYPEVDARTFIQQEFDRLSVLLVDLGNELNAALVAKAP